VSLGITFNAIFHLGSWGQAVLPVVVAQPDERHSNRISFVLKWYDRHRAYSTKSASNEKEEELP